MFQQYRPVATDESATDNRTDRWTNKNLAPGPRVYILVLIMAQV
jgi:hypothetical protein